MVIMYYMNNNHHISCRMRLKVFVCVVCLCVFDIALYFKPIIAIDCNIYCNIFGSGFLSLYLSFFSLSLSLYANITQG